MTRSPIGHVLIAGFVGVHAASKPRRGRGGGATPTSGQWEWYDLLQARCSLKAERRTKLQAELDYQAFRLDTQSLHEASNVNVRFVRQRKGDFERTWQIDRRQKRSEVNVRGQRDFRLNALGNKPYRAEGRLYERNVTNQERNLEGKRFYHRAHPWLADLPTTLRLPGSKRT